MTREQDWAFNISSISQQVGVCTLEPDGLHCQCQPINNGSGKRKTISITESLRFLFILSVTHRGTDVSFHKHSRQAAKG